MSEPSGPSTRVAWHIVTGEYPPQKGGVADYSAQVARALALRGAEVHVWAPPTPIESAREPGVRVHRLDGHFDARSVRSMMKEMDASRAPRRILLQYVAGAFGYHALNVPFCLRLVMRRREPLWVMFHEYAYPLGWRLKPSHNLLGLVTPVMAGMLAWRADRIFVSTPAWITRMPGALRDRPITWLPVPSNLPDGCDPRRAEEVRRSLLGEPTVLIGHFGTYGPPMMPLLEKLLPRLLEDRSRAVLLAGRSGEDFAARLLTRHPGLHGRVFATGDLAGPELAAHLAACDLLVQPYSDGVTSRRGTLMAGLALGLPIVTNDGAAADPLFAQEGAVALATDPGPDAMAPLVDKLLVDPELRAELSRRGRDLYTRRFSLERTVDALLSLAAQDDRATGSP